MTVSTVTVNNVHLHPDGSPVKFQKVVVALVGAGFTGTGSQVIRETDVQTDATGLASIPLVPSSQLQPPDSYYVWTGPDDVPHNFRVPDTGPANLFNNLINTVANAGGIVYVPGTGAVASVDGQSGNVNLAGTYGPGGTAGNLTKATVQGLALVQTLIYGSS